MSVLKKTDKGGGKPFSLRIPVELHERLERVKERAKQRGFEITINEAIITVIGETCDKAEEQLDQMREQMEQGAVDEQRRVKAKPITPRHRIPMTKPIKS